MAEQPYQQSHNSDIPQRRSSLSTSIHYIHDLTHSSRDNTCAYHTILNQHNCHPHRMYPPFDLEEHEYTYELFGDIPGLARDGTKISIVSDYALEISGVVQHHCVQPANDDVMTPGNDYKDPFVNIDVSRATSMDQGMKEVKVQSHKVERDEDGGPVRKTHHAENAFVNAAEAAEHSRRQSVIDAKNDIQAKTAVFRIKHLMSERRSGEFHRIFQFPRAILKDGVVARYEAGVLHVRIPKKNGAAVKEVPIDYANEWMMPPII